MSIPMITAPPQRTLTGNVTFRKSENFGRNENQECKQSLQIPFLDLTGKTDTYFFNG